MEDVVNNSAVVYLSFAAELKSTIQIQINSKTSIVRSTSLSFQTHCPIHSRTYSPIHYRNCLHPHHGIVCMRARAHTHTYTHRTTHDIVRARARTHTYTNPTRTHTHTPHNTWHCVCASARAHTHTPHSTLEISKNLLRPWLRWRCRRHRSHHWLPHTRGCSQSRTSRHICIGG